MKETFLDVIYANVTLIMLYISIGSLYGNFQSKYMRRIHTSRKKMYGINKIFQ